MDDAHTLHLTHWAAAMAADCNAAQSDIALSALSLLPPRTNSPGEWPTLWQALIAAAARGVRVTLYLAKPSPINLATTRNHGTAATANAHGIACRLIPGPHLLHCKSLTIDSRIVWIGSGNFTSAAAHHNHEAYIRAARPDFAAAVLARWKALT